MRFEQVLVTPSLAERYLKRNSVNRNISQSVVDRYARDMRNGRWEQNGDVIRFDASGSLRDGQHRLTAIVQSGETIKLNVVRGIDASGHIDSGYKRTDVHNYQIKYNDRTYTAQVEAILNLLTKASSVASKLTLSEKRIAHDYYRREIDEVLSIPNVSNTNAILKTALVIAKKYHSIPHMAAERFVYIFNSGFANDETEYAAIACRNDWQKNRQIYGTGSTARREALNIAISCVLAFTKGQIAKRLPKTVDYDYSDVREVLRCTTGTGL